MNKLIHLLWANIFGNQMQPTVAMLHIESLNILIAFKRCSFHNDISILTNQDELLSKLSGHIADVQKQETQPETSLQCSQAK